MQILTIQNEDSIEHFTLDFMARGALSSVLYTNGNCKLLATVCVDNTPAKDDFLPLSVQYVQKSYAVGKIPGGFIKREGRLSDFEILTSRAIDRALRPFFPKDFKLPLHISVTVLSYDRRLDLQVLALNAASSALYLAGFDFMRPVCATRIGIDHNDFVLNPDLRILDKSPLNLLVCGSFEDILMLEMSAKATNGIDELDLLKALELSVGFIKTHCKKQENIFSKHRANFKWAANSDLAPIQNELSKYNEILQKSLELESNNIKSNDLKELATRLSNELNCELSAANEAIAWARSDLFRENVLNGKRACGRSFDELRDITIYTNILPHAHGSALFTRGQTQALAVATIGSDSDKESRELLSDAVQQKESFSFHYNFAPFATGDVGMVMGISRREIGHGNLAKKALQDVAPRDKTIRLVSEILQSNGSSSMASVCAGSLALSACGIESPLIAGVAMGIVKNDNKSVILSDINGLEDMLGDMDCKIAGNEHYITALQLDTKITCINIEDLARILDSAKIARLKILKIMQRAKEEIILNHNALPSEVNFNIKPDRIAEVIGSGGRVIRDIISRFGVTIDINKENGDIKVTSQSTKSSKAAKEFIVRLLEQGEASENYEIDEEIVGIVSRVTDFGVFIELPRGGSGLLHNSRFIDQVDRNFFVAGNEVRCKIFALNNGKINLDLV
ncbi:MAG: polyribonucleotide nucleotidyltransferase [Helicobacter sp.]|nr:polyribonucleotide nucleotidyltransferase [Helicobacter sp.]